MKITPIIKEYSMRFIESILTVIQYPYDFAIALLCLVYLAAELILAVFVTILRGFILIGHGVNLEETLRFKKLFKWIGDTNVKLKEW